jgi:hypothetical protein
MPDARRTRTPGAGTAVAVDVQGTFALRGAPWGAPLPLIAELLSGGDGFLPPLQPGTGQDRNAGREEDEDTGRWDGAGG